MPFKCLFFPSFSLSALSLTKMASGIMVLCVLVAVMGGRGSPPICEWILVLLWKECHLSILSLLSLLAHVVEVW